MWKKRAQKDNRFRKQQEEINQNILVKKERLNRLWERFKQYKNNSTFENNGRKFYQQIGRECSMTNEHSEAKETE